MILEEARALLALRDDLEGKIEEHISLYATPDAGESKAFAEELIREGYIRLPDGVKRTDVSMAF